MPKKILFVQRKSHPGNFSIERIYNAIIAYLNANEKQKFTISKLTLHYTYDVFLFFSCFIKSLVAKKYTVHITGGCGYMVMAFPFKNRILTVHDTVHYQEMKGVKKLIYGLLFIHLPVYFSHKIVVVSQNTKNQLLVLAPKANHKIIVIHNPLLIPKEEISVRQRLFKKVVPMQVLQMGSKQLKNFERLIIATKQMHVEYHFIQSDPTVLNKLIKEHQLEDRAKVYVNSSDAEIYTLYKSADVLFFASTAEGFGLPIIEAQSFGVPVITSNLPPMNFIGQGAILVDPFSENSIREGFNALYDSILAENVVIEGLKNVTRFQLKSVVAEYSLLYDSFA